MATPDFKEYVKKRSGIFFGDRGVNAIDICSEVARGAMALGAKKTQIGIASSWHYICADMDWFSVELQHKYENEEEIFEKMHPFPEYFVNSTRYEPMTKFFSDVLVTYNGSDVKVIHGNESDARLFEKEISGFAKWKRVIGFKFNEHA